MKLNDGKSHETDISNIWLFSILFVSTGINDEIDSKQVTPSSHSVNIRLKWTLIFLSNKEIIKDIKVSFVSLYSNWVFNN